MMIAFGARRFEFHLGTALAAEIEIPLGWSDGSALVAYIDGQMRHHARRDFKGEIRAMFKQYGVEVDERFVWY
jgi:hypothetical protein